MANTTFKVGQKVTCMDIGSSIRPKLTIFQEYTVDRITHCPKCKEELLVLKELNQSIAVINTCGSCLWMWGSDNVLLFRSTRFVDSEITKQAIEAGMAIATNPTTIPLTEEEW